MNGEATIRVTTSNILREGENVQSSGVGILRDNLDGEGSRARTARVTSNPVDLTNLDLAGRNTFSRVGDVCVTRVGVELEEAGLIAHQTDDVDLSAVHVHFQTSLRLDQKAGRVLFQSNRCQEETRGVVVICAIAGESLAVDATSGVSHDLVLGGGEGSTVSGDSHDHSDSNEGTSKESAHDGGVYLL